ncbi:hypothetical protein OAG71_04080 [bacterium]|nr:hypothetical protein [bacterium]
MNESRVGRKRRRTFSLQIVLLIVSLFACCFAFYSFRLNLQRKNNAAIAELRAAGAKVFIADSGQQVVEDVEVNPATLSSAFTSNLASSVVSVDLTDPVLTESTIRKLMPGIQQLTPSHLYEPDDRYIRLHLAGNPNIPPELVEEMRNRLSKCKFIKYTPVPVGTQNSIKIGMSTQELIQTIGTLMFEQRAEWPAGKAETVKMLGSQMNTKYTSAQGLETWTYFTDDVGVGVLSIDFGADGNVSAVWSDRGVRRSRELTPNEQQVSGLGP